MSRRDNAHARCARCRVHQSLCFCAELPRIETQTRLLLVIHQREARKPTNTGLLATECLVNSEILLRGRNDERERAFQLDRDRQTLLLYPSDEAIPVERFAHSTEPVTLLVPDGNWRQAGKIRSRLPGAADLPVVSLPEGPASIYRLRHEPHVGGLATMEAIARAFGILESQSVRTQLERIFRIMVERALWSRGVLRSDQVQDGLPVGAERHDPQSGSRPSPNPATSARSESH